MDYMRVVSAVLKPVSFVAMEPVLCTLDIGSPAINSTLVKHTQIVSIADTYCVVSMCVSTCFVKRC